MRGRPRLGPRRLHPPPGEIHCLRHAASRDRWGGKGPRTLEDRRIYASARPRPCEGLAPSGIHGRAFGPRPAAKRLSARREVNSRRYPSLNCRSVSDRRVKKTPSGGDRGWGRGIRPVQKSPRSSPVSSRGTRQSERECPSAPSAEGWARADGVKYCRESIAWRDQRRENELVRAGWRVLKATSSQLDRNPDSFIDTLRALLKSGRTDEGKRSNRRIASRKRRAEDAARGAGRRLPSAAITEAE